jgi:adenylate cyclase
MDAELDELISVLRSLGATDDQLDQGPDALADLIADLSLSSGAEFTPRQAAGRSGVDVDVVLETYRQLGVALDPDSRSISAREAELLRVVDWRAPGGNFTEEEGTELLRVIAGSLATIADAVVATYVQTVELRARDAGGRLGMVHAVLEATAMAAQLGDLLGPLFLHHVRLAVDRQRQSQSGLADRKLMRLAVGFVDLVGFTTRSATMPPAELVAVVVDFERESFDLATEHGARIVKHIGDEIMFVAVDADAACAFASALTNSLTKSGTTPRAGLCFGEVLARRGDYYGPVVNLASRLVDAAAPEEVLVDRGIVEAAPARDFEPAGRRVLKGFEDPVPVWSLAPTG